MGSVNDTRRLRIYRIRAMKGELSVEQGADAWQERDGRVSVSGAWDGLLVPDQEDLATLAELSGVSPLEALRVRLLESPCVRVEVTDYAA